MSFSTHALGLPAIATAGTPQERSYSRPDHGYADCHALSFDNLGHCLTLQLGQGLKTCEATRLTAACLTQLAVTAGCVGLCPLLAVTQCTILAAPWACCLAETSLSTLARQLRPMHPAQRRGRPAGAAPLSYGRTGRLAEPYRSPP